MLGLIAGFVPDFYGGGERAVHYCEEQPGEAALWIPASSSAQGFLAKKNRYDPGDAESINTLGTEILRLFPAGDTAGGGDIIAAAFYFLSLHEEWSSGQRDRFGRFEPEQSLLGKLEMLDRPAVAEYAGLLRRRLKLAGFDVDERPRFGGRHSAVCVTHDIDYIAKTTLGLMYREAVKYFLRNELQQPFRTRAQRLKEYAGFVVHRENDPYRRSLFRMKEEEEAREFRGTWLFKAGGSHKYDTGYAPGHPFVRASIEALRESGHEIGIHPSYEAHTNANMLSEEREMLSEYAGELHSCRQHYLRFVYPDTWRIQAQEGLRVDSTLGFAGREGFRNGACHPFMPYDLETDSVIPLWELPLIAMDGTFTAYRGLDAEASRARIGELLAVIARHNGAVALLFHNVVYDPHDFPGWDRVFEKTLDAISANNMDCNGMTETVGKWLGGSGTQL